MTNNDLEQLVRVLLAKHPHLEPCIFADQGIRLMNVDCQIAERVHRHFTANEVPVLSVHDSFIIGYYRGGELKQVMADASEVVAGRPLPVSSSGIGLDELDPEKREDLVQWREERVERSAGYVARLDAWKNNNRKCDD
jgi:hypothetical protein